MPKKGERLPWRLTFQYEGQTQQNRPFSSQREAEHLAEEIGNMARMKGSVVTLAISNRDTGESYSFPRTEGDTVSDDNQATIDQVTANIERARSLAEAENLDGLAVLSEETEALISSLPTRGKGPGGESWTKEKKAMRDAFAAAVTVAEKPEPEPAPKAEVVVLETRDYHDVAGVPELVTKGADLFAEGVGIHLKASDLAKDIARVLLQMRVRMTNKFGEPDVKALSAGAKQASKDMYAKAGEAFRASGQYNALEAKQAVAKLQKSVNNFTPTIRAEYLRELDTNEEEAARFAEITVKADDDRPVSEVVAAHYGVELKSRYELDVERAELEAAGEGVDSEEADEPATPEEQIGAFFTKAADSIERAEKALKKVDDDATKESVKGRIDALIAELATLKAGL